MGKSTREELDELRGRVSHLESDVQGLKARMVWQYDEIRQANTLHDQKLDKVLAALVRTKRTN
jgi:hypothetical protein